jgi:hypothetical protein
MPGIVKSIMPYIARKYLRLRNATYYYEALIFYARIDYFKGVHEIAALSWSFCIKAKGREKKF